MGKKMNLKGKYSHNSRRDKNRIWKGKKVEKK